MSNLKWSLKHFDELTTLELYHVGNLRQQVFVLEQNCPYVDFDFLDLKCWHVMAWDEENELVAYTRLVPEGACYEKDIAIGRVITNAKVRRSGMGRILMQKSMEYCWEIFGKRNIRISAQDYLLKFYTSLGFQATEKKYLEDNIPHTEMYLVVDNGQLNS